MDGLSPGNLGISWGDQLQDQEDIVSLRRRQTAGFDSQVSWDSFRSNFYGPTAAGNTSSKLTGPLPLSDPGQNSQTLSASNLSNWLQQLAGSSLLVKSQLTACLKFCIKSSKGFSPKPFEQKQYRNWSVSPVC